VDECPYKITSLNFLISSLVVKLLNEFEQFLCRRLVTSQEKHNEAQLLQSVRLRDGAGTQRNIFKHQNISLKSLLLCKDCLLEREAMCSGINVRMFRRNLLPPSSV
jgi:hypothetical protein